METVNINDNLLRVAVHVLACEHIPKPCARWVSKNQAGKPPDLEFSGFPPDGRMLMSNYTLILACRRCNLFIDAMKATATKIDRLDDVVGLDGQAQH